MGICIGVGIVDMGPHRKLFLNWRKLSPLRSSLSLSLWMASSKMKVGLKKKDAHKNIHFPLLVINDHEFIKQETRKRMIPPNSKGQNTFSILYLVLYGFFLVTELSLQLKMLFLNTNSSFIPDLFFFSALSPEVLKMRKNEHPPHSP